MQQLNNTSALHGQQHKRLPSRLILALFFLLPLVGWGQGIPTITTDANGNGTIDDNEKVLYLIQTNQFQSFYMVDTLSGTKITTNNIPNPHMLWYFLDAGIEGTTQYYYIVSNSANKYICHGGGTANNETSRGVSLVVKDASNEERCKFKLVEDNSDGTVGFYNIDVKGSPTYYGLNKQNGSVNYSNPIRLTNTQFIHDYSSKWKFIPYNGTFTWPAPPFTPSTNSQNYYYKIHNVVNGAYYVSSDASSPKNVTIASTVSNNMAWYFKEASTDSWIKYYYIVNPEAGEYMYYKGTATNGSNQSNAIILKEKTSENEDRFQFIIVQTARTVNDNPVECYTIIPKLLKDQYFKSNSISPTSITEGNTLGIRNGRGDANNNSHWGFESTVYPTSCARPTITYSSATGKITITTTPADADIHYTTDGVTVPSSTVGTLYNEPFAVSSPMTIMAIATKTGYADSPVETVAFNQVATPGFELTDDAKVRLTCATSGASIYYAMGTTQPTSVTIDPSNLYSGPIENAAGKYIAAVAVKDGLWINSTLLQTGQITFPCAKPVIRKTSATTFTITCSYPTSGVHIYYNTGDGNQADPTDESTEYISEVTFDESALPFTVKAIAYAAGYDPSAVATQRLTQDLTLDSDGFYVIASYDNYETFVSMVNENDENAAANYKITADINVSGAGVIDQYPFTGELKSVAKADGTFPVVSGLSHAIFNTVNNGKVHDIMLKNIEVSGSGNVGAICNEARGASRIYNCGILPHDSNLTSTSSVGSNGGYCGGLVGLLDGSSRVINCFSFANITGGTVVAGIVGYNNTSGATQSNYTEKAIVMNCMFYGEISGDATKYPVYGGNVIANDGEEAINNYNYYRGEATFDDAYSGVANYNRSWPAEERNLRRFEYYRSILNSNRRLCTWWVSGTHEVAPTDDDVASVGIAKWVVDRSIAPYPVLKPWGKYPSVINPDPLKVWDTINNQWVLRVNAQPYQGKNYGTLSVTIRTGAHPGEEGMTGISVINDKSWTLTITDMDTLNHDYCYYKVQLPYYNEVFGDPNETDHIKRYYGNYTNKVVTGWKILSVNDNDQGTAYTFDADWQAGCNFADRSDKYKDLQAKSGRVFAQGGYYYVPEGVTSITIEAYWGTAIYMHGKGHSLDRVSVCTYDGNEKNYGYAFTPAGTLPTNWVYNDMTIYDDLGTVMGALETTSSTVYDQAVVLVGNFQVQARNDIDLNYTNGKKVTFMSADLDFDNEPDFCWQFQWRNNYDRRPILPVRFDFLPITELGLAIRHNTYAYAIGIMVPIGHFEITETSFMYTTQFEYMASNVGNNHQQPLIFNGGQFEQIVCKGNSFGQLANTRNIIMGGHIWMKRFTPGSHAGDSHRAKVRHCAVSIMGGEYPEFYLSGLYRSDVTTSTAYNDNPHCYTNGGRFGIMAGAGMEAVKGSVFFEIDHSIIREFYGGGINGNDNNRVNGSIDVTINNSLVTDKYCGGPKVGVMADGTTVTTEATGTIFNEYYGGGNGGTNLYREEKADKTPDDMPDEATWSGSEYGWSSFTPISSQGATATYSGSYGYHAEFEFEVFNQSNGINAAAVARSYYHWAQFGTTTTGDVTNKLVDCTVKHNYYGGGNLGNVGGKVNSTLTDCTIIGSAYGGGYSASIPKFSVHDKSKVSFPYRDAAGICHNGSVGYRTDGDVVREYTWCYKNPTTNVVTPSGVIIPDGVNTTKPAFQYNGRWYCYTEKTLENLGAISQNVTLTINGNSTIGGDVFGGGQESVVSGNTTVTLQGKTIVTGNVYGGGDQGAVGGNATVTIEPEPEPDPEPEPELPNQD